MEVSRIRLEGRLDVRVCESPCAERPNGPDTLILYSHRSKSGTLVVDTLPPGSTYMRANQVAAQYYPLTLSVVCFIRERGGIPAIRGLRSRIERRAVGDPISDLPNLPSTPEGFEDAWRQWLRTAHACG